MTISSSTRKAGPFTGNGTTATYPFTFKIFQASDLLVVRTSLTGVDTTLTLTTDYTVSLNADQNSAPGGSITLTAGNLATGLKVTMTSQVPYTQTTDLTNQGGFYPQVITTALDKLTIGVQPTRATAHSRRAAARDFTASRPCAVRGARTPSCSRSTRLGARPAA